MIQDTTYQETYPRLFAQAYRMTGSVADAEDVVQEAWIRLLKQPAGKIDMPAHWLYRTVSNLAIDALRVSKRTATGYHGPWLPEPIASEQYFRGPEAEAIVREDLSMALLIMLELLTPEQRAVWVLRTSLELSFAEIARMIGQTETNCRQLFRRASLRMEQSEEHELTHAPAPVVELFIAAVQAGDAGAVAQLLLNDAVWIGDGGGVKPATMRPVLGADRVARGISGIFAKAAEFGVTTRMESWMLNGHPGVVVYIEEELDAVYTLLGCDQGISQVLVVRNPHKLRGVAARIEPAGGYSRGGRFG